jgi:hypothetical protein
VRPGASGGTGSAAPLWRVQRGLEDLYRVHTGVEIGDFVVGAELRDALVAARRPREQLLVCEAEGEMALAIRCARAERPVSQLELELQAEVDKYVTCLLATEPGAEVSAALRRRLFGDVAYEPDLDHEERDRYRAANDNAQRYAAYLEQAFVVPRRIPEMLAELRRFYRLGLAGKLGSIARAASRAA